MSKVVLIVQLGDLHVGFQIGVVNSLALSLLKGSSYIEVIVKRNLLMEHRIVPIRYRSVAVTFQGKPLSEFLPLLPTDTDAEISFDGQHNYNNETPLL